MVKNLEQGWFVVISHIPEYSVIEIKSMVGGYMAQIYDKPIWKLLIDFAMLKKDGGCLIFTIDEASNWFQSNYPLVKIPSLHLTLNRMCTNIRERVLWKPRIQDNVFFYLGNGEYRFYDGNSDPRPLMNEDDISSSVTDMNYVSQQIGEEQPDIVDRISSEFAYERDLQNFIVKNLHLVENGLHLYNDEEISGVEYPAGNGRIDILAMDNDDNFVVIELKVDRGDDRVMGQTLRYIAWIKRELAEENQHVRGIIIAKNISENLRLACTLVSDISLLEYSLDFKLEEVN